MKKSKNRALLVLNFFAALALASCSGVTLTSLTSSGGVSGISQSEVSSSESVSEQVSYEDDNEIHRIYLLYVANASEQGETPLSYEEWLASIKGEKGDPGEKGDKGDTGANGQTPHIGENGNWWIGDQDTGIAATGPKGDTGATGAQGEKGDKGDTGAQGEKGDKGDKGDTGDAGEDGQTPRIGENGNWWIGDKDTGIAATGPKGDTGATGAQGEKGDKGDKGDAGEKGDKGDKGEDGTSFRTGASAPKDDLGKEGDAYLDFLTYDLYIKDSLKGWVLIGNIKGKDAEKAANEVNFGFDNNVEKEPDGTVLLTWECANNGSSENVSQEAKAYVNGDGFDVIDQGQGYIRIKPYNNSFDGRVYVILPNGEEFNQWFEYIEYEPISYVSTSMSSSITSGAQFDIETWAYGKNGQQAVNDLIVDVDGTSKEVAFLDSECDVPFYRVFSFLAPEEAGTYYVTLVSASNPEVIVKKSFDILENTYDYYYASQSVDNRVIAQDRWTYFGGALISNQSGYTPYNDIEVLDEIEGLELSLQTYSNFDSLQIYLQVTGFEEGEYDIRLGNAQGDVVATYHVRVLGKEEISRLEANFGIEDGATLAASHHEYRFTPTFSLDGEPLQNFVAPRDYFDLSSDKSVDLSVFSDGTCCIYVKDSEAKITLSFMKESSVTFTLVNERSIEYIDYNYDRFELGKATEVYLTAHYDDGSVESKVNPVDAKLTYQCDDGLEVIETQYGYSITPTKAGKHEFEILDQGGESLANMEFFIQEMASDIVITGLQDSYHGPAGGYIGAELQMTYDPSATIEGAIQLKVTADEGYDADAVTAKMSYRYFNVTSSKLFEGTLTFVSAVTGESLGATHISFVSPADIASAEIEGKVFAGKAFAVHLLAGEGQSAQDINVYSIKAFWDEKEISLSGGSYDEDDGGLTLNYMANGNPGEDHALTIVYDGDKTFEFKVTLAQPVYATYIDMPTFSRGDTLTATVYYPEGASADDIYLDYMYYQYPSDAPVVDITRTEFEGGCTLTFKVGENPNNYSSQVAVRSGGDSLYALILPEGRAYEGVHIDAERSYTEDGTLNLFVWLDATTEDEALAMFNALGNLNIGLYDWSRYDASHGTNAYSRGASKPAYDKEAGKWYLIAYFDVKEAHSGTYELLSSTTESGKTIYTFGTYEYVAEKEPVNTLYLKLFDDSNFDILSDDARIAVYMWFEDGTDRWVDVTEHIYRYEGGLSIYVDIPDNAVGFNLVRLDPKGKLDWGSKWNQTDDILLKNLGVGRTFLVIFA